MAILQSITEMSRLFLHYQDFFSLDVTTGMLSCCIHATSFIYDPSNSTVVVGGYGHSNVFSVDV